MSVINGDKSRFNREGTKQIASRALNRERLKNVVVQPKSPVSEPELRQKWVRA